MRRYSQACYENNKKAEMGVSATHLDWTLVPYVKKSFYKHYKNGINYILDINETDKNNLLEALNNTLSIEDEKYKREPKVYRYAYEMTIKEVNQGVESLYHNLG